MPVISLRSSLVLHVCILPDSPCPIFDVSVLFQFQCLISCGHSLMPLSRSAMLTPRSYSGSCLMALVGNIIGASAQSVNQLIGTNCLNGLARAGQLSFSVIIGELVPNKQRGHSMRSSFQHPSLLLCSVLPSPELSMRTLLCSGVGHISGAASSTSLPLQRTTFAIILRCIFSST
jgi:hypothetical protein